MKNWLLTLTSLFFLSNIVLAQPSDFYDNKTVQEIKITFQESNWRYLLDSLRLNGSRFLLGNAEINGTKFPNIGVRYSGTRSFITGGKRNGLFIKLNLVNRTQNLQGVQSVRLSSALRDPSMIREVLSYEIARDYMPAPKANFAKVFINGEYYGLLVNVQPVDAKFLENGFGSSDGTFVKCNPPLDSKEPADCKKKIHCNLEYDAGPNCYFHNYELLSEYGWDDLIELTRILNEEPGKIESILNVDRTLWMLAFNNVLVNLNSYSGAVSENYYIYRDSFGKFNPIIWDMNLSFGSFKNTGQGSDLDLKGLQQLDPLLHETSPTKPLISKLLKNDEYKRKYIAHMRTILYDWFVTEKYMTRAKELQSMIESLLVNDVNKFYEMEDFSKSLKSTIGQKSKIPGIEELMDKRTDFLKKHPVLSVIPPQFETNFVAGRGELESKKVEDFKIQTKVSKFTKRVHIFYRFEGESAYREMPMKDDGQHFDEQAGDNIFGTIIKPEGEASVVEYYFLAENAGALSFDPPKYMFAPHRIGLEDLNK